MPHQIVFVGANLDESHLADAILPTISFKSADEHALLRISLLCRNPDAIVWRFECYNQMSPSRSFLHPTYSFTQLNTPFTYRTDTFPLAFIRRPSFLVWSPTVRMI